MKSKKLIVFLFLILLILTGIAFYLLNKGPINLTNEEGIKVNASTLYTSFCMDPVNTKKVYTGKILEVSGQVNNISLNQQKEKIIMLKTSCKNAYINCTMDENISDIQINRMLKIKGICSGIGQGDIDLGIKGDVYLTRCILIN